MQQLLLYVNIIYSLFSFYILINTIFNLPQSFIRLLKLFALISHLHRYCKIYTKPSLVLQNLHKTLTFSSCPFVPLLLSNFLLPYTLVLILIFPFLLQLLNSLLPWFSQYNTSYILRLIILYTNFFLRQ